MPILIKNNSTTLATLTLGKWVAPAVKPRKKEIPIPGTARSVTFGDGFPEGPHQLILILEVQGTSPSDTDNKLHAIHQALASCNRIYPTASRYWAVKYVAGKDPPDYSTSRLTCTQKVILTLEDPYTHTFPGDGSTRETP